MKACISALLGAAGLVALSLSAQAAGSTGDSPLLKSTTTPSMQIAQRSENPGGGMYKKKKKKAKTKTS